MAVLVTILALVINHIVETTGTPKIYNVDMSEIET